VLNTGLEKIKNPPKNIFTKIKNWATSYWTLAAYCIINSPDNPLLLLRTGN
jgi:hypothetical protein